MSENLLDSITDWLKKATRQTTSRDRREFTLEFDKAFREKNARKLERMVEQFKRSGPGFKREVLTILSALNHDAMAMLQQLGR